MIKKSLLVVLCAAGLSSCLPKDVESGTTQLNKQQEKIIDEYVANNNLTGKKETLYSINGDYYPIYSMVSVAGDDPTQYKNNESISIAYTIKDIQGKVIETKTEADSVLIYVDFRPGKKIVGLSWCASQFLGKGGKGTFIIPSTIGYETKPPAGVESNAILILDVHVIDRMTETQQFQWYAKKNKLPALETTSTGLAFAKTLVKADSTLATDAASVTVRYMGKFLTGEKFDENVTTAGVTFPLNGTIPGFAEAIKKMRVGEKATALLPYKLGYGEYGDSQGKIPGYTPLVFDIELVKFTK